MDDSDVLNSLSKVNKSLLILCTDELMWRSFRRNALKPRLDANLFHKPQRPDRKWLAEHGILRARCPNIERGEYLHSRASVKINETIRRIDRKLVEQRILKKLKSRPDVNFLWYLF
jgi:hypothetical protein